MISSTSGCAGSSGFQKTSLSHCKTSLSHCKKSLSCWLSWVEEVAGCLDCWLTRDPSSLTGQSTPISTQDVYSGCDLPLSTPLTVPLGRSSMCAYSNRSSFSLGLRRLQHKQDHIISWTGAGHARSAGWHSEVSSCYTTSL